MPAWQGDEAAALAHLRRYLGSGFPHTYKATRNALIGRDFASHWSPWLANGALSVRRAVADLKALEAERGANDGSYWLWFELLWRELLSLHAAPPWQCAAPAAGAPAFSTPHAV